MNEAVVAETVRRHVTNVFYLAFLVCLLMVAFLASSFHSPASMWPSLVWLLAVVTGAGLIGPEFSSGTLQLVVSKPISRSVYLVSRLTGVMIVVSLTALAAFGMEALGRAIGGGPFPAPTMLTVLANAVTGCALVCALLVLLGSVTRAYFNVAIFFLLQTALSISLGILGLMRSRGVGDYEAIERVLTAAEQVLFPESPPQFDGVWLFRVLMTAAVAVALACLAFQRREVPYGAD